MTNNTATEFLRQGQNSSPLAKSIPGQREAVVRLAAASAARRPGFLGVALRNISLWIMPLSGFINVPAKRVGVALPLGTRPG
jgi:hypothetical protein